MILVKDAVVQHRPLGRDGVDTLSILDLAAVHQRVFELALACGDAVAPRVDRDIAAALANRRARHIHRRVARADDGDAVAEMVDIRVLEVVDRIVTVAERFAVNAKALRTPCTRAHKDCLVAVAEQVVHRERAADRCVRADVDAERAQLFAVAVNGRGRQTKIRDAVAQHASNLLHALEDRDTVALLRELDCDHDARRPRADHGDVVSVVGFAREDELVEVGVRDVVLDARDLDRRAAPSLNAVALALRVVVADERAEDAHRIVVVEHRARLVDLAVEEEADHLRHVRLHGAALHAAERLFALEAAACLVDDVNSHDEWLLSLYCIAS